VSYKKILFIRWRLSGRKNAYNRSGQVIAILEMEKGFFKIIKTPPGLQIVIENRD
jgi:hypothetical protein